MILLQMHYLGEDDHTNQWPLLITLVGIYFFWKWIQSVKNDSSPRRAIEASSKEANIKSEEVKQSEVKEPIKPKIELKGSLANLSLKKAATNSEASKDAMDEGLKPQNKPLLKGSLAGLSFRKSERDTSSNLTKEEPKLPASDDDESVV